VPPDHSTSLLDDLIRIENQITADANRSYQSLQARDRRIGVELAFLKDKPTIQVRHWVSHINTPSSQQDRVFGQTSRAISLLLVLAGAIIGVGAALGLFYYTGEQPINIINVLAVGVGLQLILLIAFLLAVSPGIPFLTNALAGFSPGRWALRLASLLPSLRAPVESLHKRRTSTAEHQLLKWQTAYWSQIFAVWFNIGLICGGLYLISFSDLAFGWNTTLSLDSGALASISDTLSLPWRDLLPQAVPDLSLIESTRFYRLQSAGYDAGNGSVIDQAQTAGSWWRFLLLCLVVYGLLPRLVTLGICRLRLGHAGNQAILSIPGLHLVLDRMNSPSVATAAETPEAPPAAESINTARPVTALSKRPTFVYHWGQPAADPGELQAWLTSITGARTESFTAIAASSAEGVIAADTLPEIKANQAMAVLVKAWEPPTLEITDWLAEARRHYGQQTLIAVVAYDIGDDTVITGPAQTDCQTWSDFLKHHNAHHVEFHGDRR